VRHKEKIAGLLLLIGGLASSQTALAGNCRALSGAYCEDAQQRIIPVRVFRNFLVVLEGQLGGTPVSRNFILDTGTAPSIMDVTVVKDLGVPTVSSRFRALGKTIPAQAAIIPDLELGPIRAASLPVQVQDLSRLERDLGIPIAGIVGMDVLSKSSFHLDYVKKEIEFGEVSPAGIPVHFDARAGIAVAEVSIEGRRARILVDTGSDRVVLFGGNFAEAGWPELRKTSQSGSSLADPGMSLQVFSAPDIILGGQHFSDDRAYFVPGNADPAFDGLLGVRALGFKGLSYDRSSGTIFLRK
jgi:hypothetical protein